MAGRENQRQPGVGNDRVSSLRFLMPWKELRGSHTSGPMLTWALHRVTCSAVGNSPLEKRKDGSIGELNPNCEGKIMSDDGLSEVCILIIKPRRFQTFITLGIQR